MSTASIVEYFASIEDPRIERSRLHPLDSVLVLTLCAVVCGVFVHMVSAWAAKNRLVLGQVKTDEKSNEIAAIPRLLQLLNIHGCLVGIDAMGCQKDIAQAIGKTRL